jgi:hypothetical protein
VSSVTERSPFCFNTEPTFLDHEVRVLAGFGREVANLRFSDPEHLAVGPPSTADLQEPHADAVLPLVSMDQS